MRCFGNQTSAGGLCIRHKAEKPPWTSSCLRRVSTRPGALAPISFGLNDGHWPCHLDHTAHHDRPGRNMLQRKLAQAGLALHFGPTQTGFGTS